MPKDPARGRRPLPGATFQILVALADRERHGYAIMREVEHRTEGRSRLGPGTLYTSIRKMRAAGLIETCAPPSGGEADDERRRYYRLTRLGREAARAELERLERLVRSARRSKLGLTLSGS